MAKRKVKVNRNPSSEVDAFIDSGDGGNASRFNEEYDGPTITESNYSVSEDIKKAMALVKAKSFGKSAAPDTSGTFKFEGGKEGKEPKVQKIDKPKAKRKASVKLSPSMKAGLEKKIGDSGKKEEAKKSSGKKSVFDMTKSEYESKTKLTKGDMKKMDKRRAFMVKLKNIAKSK